MRHRVLTSNGIQTRHYAVDPETGRHTHSNATMTRDAIVDLAESRGFALDDLELLSCGTSTPDQLLPNHGVMVHAELGNGPCEVVATAGVCCCGVTALKNAWLNVAGGLVSNAVASGSELASGLMVGKHFQPEIDIKLEELEATPTLAFSHDFLRFMLSDGAGAVLLEDKPRSEGLSLRIDWIELVSFANEVETCMYLGGAKREDGSLQGWLGVDDPSVRVRDGYFNLSQDIKLLNGRVIQYTVGRALQHFRKKRELDADAIDWFLPHYSSHYFRSVVAEVLAEAELPIPEERWFTNLYTKGNTGSASIFIMLDELMKDPELGLKEGQTILAYVPESGRFSSSFFHLTVVGPGGA